MPARIVGLDFGLVRVGIAVADPLRIFASPLGTFSRKEALTRLREMRSADGLERIILGWPLQLDGKEGETVALVRKFERQLQGALPGIEIVRWDERYTSKMAEDAIREQGGTRKSRRQKGRVDAAAAAILLQSYLDSRQEQTDLIP